jgi:hypothetical protein
MTGVVVAVLIAMLLSSCGDRQQRAPVTTETAEEATARHAREAEARRQVAELDGRCMPGSALHAEAERLMKSGRPELAYDALSICGERLSRQPVLDELHTKASAAARKRIEARERQARAAETVQARALKKRSGVSIGMSKQDVLDSSWGKPQMINRNINASGVSEQWVYPAGSYLYFEGDVLTTIQN